MPPENDEKDEKDELVVIEDPPADTPVETTDDDKSDADKQKEGVDDAGKDDAGKAADADDEDDEDDDAEKGDQRASSEAEADAADADRKKKDRESSAERRKRQREARERLETELRVYQRRNEELERRFSTVEQRQLAAEKLTIAQAIEQVEAQLKQAREIEAAAIKESDGDSAVEAREIAESLTQKRQRLLQAKAKAERPPQRRETTAPPEMQAAFGWIQANKDWYDPHGGNEDSVLASAIEDRLSRENKFHPASPEFWAELDRRLAARGIGKKPTVDEKEEENDNAHIDAALRSGSSKPAGERKDARTKSNGGPKVSVNGANRALKANEVYVSPERKAAMIELGAWDDPVLKQKLLRDYQRYDRDAKAAAR